MTHPGSEEFMAESNKAECPKQTRNEPEAGSETNGTVETAPLTEPCNEDLKARLEAKEKEYRETVDQLLRVSADFENYKKRSAREQEDFRKYANQSLLKEMLSAVDHIELAIKAASSGGSEADIAEGLNLTLKELLRVFEKFGVTAIEAEGKPFNPEFHEAMMREDCDALPANTVLRECRRGT
jgi:molecular chaperone GrpE